MESEKTSGGDKYSKLAGNTIIFAISSFSSKLLTLIVQPFLTYAMAEISDLGLSKILSQYANLLIPFVSMGMSNAIIRFGLDKGNSEKQVFTNGLLQSSAASASSCSAGRWRSFCPIWLSTACSFIFTS